MAEKTHILSSLGESFTSTAIGFAVADGRLNLDDRFLQFFADDAPTSPSDNLNMMWIRDLLPMNTGQHDELNW